LIYALEMQAEMRSLNGIFQPRRPVEVLARLSASLAVRLLLRR